MASVSDFFAPFSRRAWIFAFLAFLIAFNGLGTIGIFDLDEGLYSTASRQMLESGNWVVPYIGPDVRFAKPPLIYWLQAPSIWLFGPTPFAVRFPVAVCVVVTGLLLWWTLAKQNRERAGWIAALAFVGSPLSLVLARQGIIDALLGLLFTGAVVAWIGIENRKKGAYLALGVLMGFSILAKSTIGLLLPLGAFVTWQLLNRRSPRGWLLPLCGAVGLALLIAAPWHFLMWRATGDQFWQEAFVSNQIRRAQGQEWGHVQPFWFYIPVLIGVMLPWSALAPLAWWRGLQTAIRSAPDDNPSEFRPAVWAWWALVVFVFFSIAKSKLPGYIFPVVPALAVLIGWRLDELWSARRPLSRVETFFLAFVPIGAGLTLLGAGAMSLPAGDGIWLESFLDRPSGRTVETLRQLAPAFWSGGALFALVGVALGALRNRPGLLTPALATFSAVLAIFLVHAVTPLYARREIEPLHTLARATIPFVEHGDDLIVNALRPYRPSVRFVVGNTPRVHVVQFDPIMGELVRREQERINQTEIGSVRRARLRRHAIQLAWRRTAALSSKSPGALVLAMREDAPPPDLKLQKLEERGDFVLYRSQK